VPCRPTPGSSGSFPPFLSITQVSLRSGCRWMTTGSVMLRARDVTTSTASACGYQLRIALEEFPSLVFPAHLLDGLAEYLECRNRLPRIAPCTRPLRTPRGRR
jgi:hypothetical protein